RRGPEIGDYRRWQPATIIPFHRERERRVQIVWRLWLVHGLGSVNRRAPTVTVRFARNFAAAHPVIRAGGCVADRCEMRKSRRACRDHVIQTAPCRLRRTAKNAHEIVHPSPTRLHIAAWNDNLEKALRSTFIADEGAVGLREGSGREYNLCPADRIVHHMVDND